MLVWFFGLSCLFLSLSTVVYGGSYWHAYDEELLRGLQKNKKCHASYHGKSPSPSRHGKALLRRRLEQSSHKQSTNEEYSGSFYSAPRNDINHDNNNETAVRHNNKRRLLSPKEIDLASDSDGDAPQFDASCPCYRNATRPYPESFVESLSLWPDLMSDFDRRHGESLYGSQWALEEIHRSQNPPNCSEAKYIVSGGWSYGFGSRIHMEGMALAIAMQLGRVFLVHPDGDSLFWETKVPFCKDIRKDSTLECFYERVSSKCTIQDAIKASGFAKDVNSFRTYYTPDFSSAFLTEEDLERTKAQLDNQVAINLMMMYSRRGVNIDTKTYIPHQIHRILQCVPMRPEFHYYFWRAVSATYILRPERKSMWPLLQELKMKTLLQERERNKKANVGKTLLDNKATNNTEALFPRDQCVAMFVRHGDKGIEMKLLEFPTYRETAQSMWDGGLVPKSSYMLRDMLASRRLSDSRRNSEEEHVEKEGETKLRKGVLPVPSSLAQTRVNDGAIIPLVYFKSWSQITALPHTLFPQNGTIFLTTEDAAVIKEADDWGRANGWQIVYTDLFDRTKQLAAKTWDEQERQRWTHAHDKYEYISMILNLQFALECEAWVCTLASNSCRVIDELRATIGGKANRFFADLSGETCYDPPCVAGHGRIKQLGE